MRDVIHSCGEGWLLIDFSRCNATELFSIYQEFGLLCAKGRARRVLLKTGNEDADVH